MSSATVPSKRRAFGATMRRDAWWTQPLFVFLGLATFLVYSTWAAFQGNHYWLDQNGANYLSPFYSPELLGNSPHAIFGPKPAWWPGWLLFSPAFLVLLASVCWCSLSSSSYSVVTPSVVILSGIWSAGF